MADAVLEGKAKREEKLQAESDKVVEAGSVEDTESDVPEAVGTKGPEEAETGASVNSAE